MTTCYSIRGKLHVICHIMCDLINVLKFKNKKKNVLYHYRTSKWWQRKKKDTGQLDI